MSVILFYTPFYRRSRDTESLMLHFKSSGHRVVSLTQGDGYEINSFLKKKGIETYSYVVHGRPTLLYYLRHLFHFISFCQKEKISVVFSHLDAANFIASMGQYFIRAKVYLCRHHVDEALLYDYHLSWSYKLTNLLAKKIIVVSKRSLNYMINVEKVDPSKLLHINLAYDFSLYDLPSPEDVDDLKKRFQADLLLITICRLTRYKRPDLSIKVVKKLREKGLDCKLVILGSGDNQGALESEILQDNLTDYVFLLGQVPNVLNYLAASDILLHPSILESSCVAIKEAGLMHKPVIVCRNIGDFDEYIKDGSNGFLVNKDHFIDEAVEIIFDNMEKKRHLGEIGDNLNREIVNLFDIKNVFPDYQVLI